ncbi:MAG: tetratricopeptide repeat protein [Acidobacteria bacterium]|nr:tetratricopeptide repeat protein [Acidobacteriota bacterium]
MSDVTSAVSQQAVSKAQDHANKGLQFAQKGDLKNAEAELRRAVEVAPRNPLYWSDLGSILRTQKKLEEAINCYQKALKIDSRNCVIRRNLALTQWDLGQLPEAIKNLESVLSTRPDDKLATLMLGMVTESLKDYAAARKLLESVLDLVRERLESVASLARAYYHTGEKKKARETLESLAAVQAVEPEKIFACAQVALEADDYETAERLLLSIRSTYPDATMLGYSLAVIQFRAGRVDESEKALLELIRTERSNSQVYNLLGHCFQKQGKVEQAVGAFEKAVERDPAHESNYLDLLRLLATNNLWRPTLELAKKAVEKVPVSHSLYEVKGLSETILLLTADAIRSYTRALELNPASAKANLGLAVAQSAAGMNKEAAATFERGIQQFPRDALHYQEYGLMLLKQGAAGNSAAEVRGISLLETALSLENRLSEAQYHLGSLALTRGETQRALPHLETAVKLEPNVSKIRFALARAYRRLGRTDEASKELENYHRLKAVEENSNPGFPAVGAQFK